jgi:carbon storage regulator
MLVLSRKIGEKLVIGDLITVVVSRVAGNRVALGIEAPSNVKVVRFELTPEGQAAAAEKKRLRHEPRSQDQQYRRQAS